MKNDFGYCNEVGCENRTAYGYCALTACNKNKSEIGKRYVYAIRIFEQNGYQPMAELAFDDGGRVTGETTIIHWDDISEREKYCISSHTLVWDERTRGKAFSEYVVELIVSRGENEK